MATAVPIVKALFVHETRYAKRDDGVFSSSHFSAQAWERYLDVFDSLQVVGRAVREGEATDAMVRSDRDGVCFETLPDLNSIGKLIQQRGAASRQLAQLVEGVDAVILRGITGLGALAHRAARRAGKPVALEMSGCPFDNSWNYGSTLGRIAAPVRYLVGRRIAADADAVIYVTDRFLQRRYPANGLQAVASNVELPDLEATTLEQRRERIERAPQPWTIGLIGKVDHRLKGIHVALDAIAAVRDQLPELRFRILGEGSPARWTARAQQLGLGDEVQFDGRLAPGEAVRRWLDEIDLYLQPSFHEGLPRATIEAMSRGCPVLGSTAGGIPELLPEYRLHRPGDALTLGRQLAALAASREAQLEDAARNFSYVERFTASVLRPHRAEFWRQFAQFCERNR